MNQKIFVLFFLIIAVMPCILFGQVDKEWIARYTGKGSGIVDVKAGAVSSAGNIYIAGSVFNSATYDDYALIKYNASGVLVWMRTYDGEAHHQDKANAMTLDNEENIYITGGSENQVVGENIPTTDYLTIKYNSSGDIIWAARYRDQVKGLGFNEACAITVDDTGNVYITGSTGYQYWWPTTGPDYLTLKYDNNGTLLWAVYYDDPYHGYDNAKAIAIDGSGCVYVTGSSWQGTNHYDITTVKYDTDGNQLWVQNYDGPSHSSETPSGLKLDSNGAIYVVGSSEAHAVVIKYDSEGNQLWADRYEPESNITAFSLDTSGNLYVTGNQLNSSNNRDYLTIKYSSAGIRIWTALYDGPINGMDYARAIAPGCNGEVYVTGFSEGNTNTIDSLDYATIKYSSNGSQAWAQRYNGAENGQDKAQVIAVDTACNAYVSGSSEETATIRNFATIKYNAAGQQEWVVINPAPLAGTDSVLTSDIAIDHGGNIYVTGATENDSNRFDFGTTKFDTEGNMLWVAKYNGITGLDDYGQAIAVDDGGNVFVAGQSWKLSSDPTSPPELVPDFVTIKYDTNGNKRWEAQNELPLMPIDCDYPSSYEITDIILDAQGNIIVGGIRAICGPAYLIKYDPNGTLSWSTVLDTGAFYKNDAKGLLKN